MLQVVSLAGVERACVVGREGYDGGVGGGGMVHRTRGGGYMGVGSERGRSFMRTTHLVGLATLSFEHLGSNAMLAMLGVLVTAGDVETRVEFLLEFSNTETLYTAYPDSMSFGATASSSACVKAGVCRC